MSNNRYHKALGERWKRTRRADLQRFSFRWGGFAYCVAARDYTYEDVRREEEREELIATNPRQARRRGYWF
jgi:hypothetical protein